MEKQFFFGILALVSAASWALGTVLWHRIGKEIPPFSMNLGKGIIGILFLAVVIPVIGMKPVDPRSFVFLGISGFLGITLGDTLFFISLRHIGPRLSSLMTTLVPVSIAVLAVVFLGERLSFWAWGGIFITIIGVFWILWERIPAKEIKNKSLGIKYRLLSVICMALGVIFAKIGVTAVPAIQATFIRLLWGVAGLILWGFLNRQLKGWLIPFKDPRLLKNVSMVVFITVFGGFWLSLISLKYMNASISSTLNSTAPLFILPIAAVILKEKISLKAVLGAIIAVAGVALLLEGFS